MINRPIVVFDLDGTLADTAPDLLGTLNRITEPYGIAPTSIDHVGQIIGQGAKAMVAKAFELAGKELDVATHEALFQEFLADYSANIANDTKLFDGVITAMDRLEAKGFCFAVCTNKIEKMARDLLPKLDISHRFQAVTGGDTFDFRKPDGRHIHKTIKLAGGDPDRAIMIGDSSTDINAAIDARIPSVAVSFGYSDVPVETLGADVIIDHFDQLFNAVIERIS